MGNKASAALRVIQIGTEEDHNAASSGGEQPNNFDPNLPQYPESQYPPTGEEDPSEKVMSATEFIAAYPRRVNAGDIVIIKGKTSEDGTSFTLALVDGSNNIDNSQVPLQLCVDLLERHVTLTLVQNGQNSVVSREEQAELIPGSEWEFMLRVNEAGKYIYIAINGTYHSMLELKHGLHQIKYLRISGHIETVKSLEFQFA